MDLKFCLKCILSFILCIWRGESVNSMECQVGDVGQKSDIRLYCSSPRDLHETYKENCQFFSCRQNETVVWKITDPKRGVLEVQLENLPQFCSFEWYEIDLEVYDAEEVYSKDFICDTVNTPWKTHSRRTLENSICSNCSSLSSEDCVQVYTAIFRYVYPGFYRIKVTPYINGGTWKAQRSYPVHINNTVTYYVQKKFSDLKLNTSLQYRILNRELDIGIPILVEEAPHAVKMDVKFSHDYILLYGIKFGNGNLSSIKCQETGILSLPTCQVRNASLECKFYNMSHGLYGIHVHFTDDRCRKGTVWADKNSDPCNWIIRKNVTVDGVVLDEILPGKESLAPEGLYTIILIVILIGVIIMSFIAKKVSWCRQRLGNGIIGKASETIRKTKIEQTYNFNSGHANKFNFGQLLTLSERPRPEVLLVYTRETLPFMDLVTCLRRVLDKICKCQVYDYFDTDLWNDVSQDPKGWVYALIVERQAKVIIIASEVAAIRHRSLMGEFPARSYKTPHAFDHLFLYALRLLRDGMEEDSYKNHFVVTFDGFTESNHLLEYFNPYMRFVLPKHLNKLFEHLHNPDTTMHFDTNKLEERYEVRQLRLQLEHLKNLKLLAKSDLDSLKLYDW